MRVVFTYGGPNVYDRSGLSPALITMEQHGGRKKLFRVTYGLQVSDNLTYLRASHELGACIMHHLACESRLDNDGA